MKTRQRFKAIMQFQPFDRLPVIEWAGWWDKTLKQWYKEGLPLYITDRYEICEYLGLELYKQQWIASTDPTCPRPEHYGAGIIKNETDYLAVKPHLFPHDFFDAETWAEWVQEQQSGISVLWLSVDGPFWFPRTLFGIEKHLYAFYDQPELMHRIIDDLTEWSLSAIDKIAELGPPDFIAFAEDLSYNLGPMLSKNMFNEFLLPYYERVIPRVKHHNIIPFIDSDGDISELAWWCKSAGIEGILPLERQSGVDIAQLRLDHPNLRFIGHFDKMTMCRGEEAMRAEFERLLPTAAEGGFLPACDHQTPPGVSLENYKIYLKLFREYAAQAGKMSRREAKLK